MLNTLVSVQARVNITYNKIITILVYAIEFMTEDKNRINRMEDPLVDIAIRTTKIPDFLKKSGI
jgi:hypothetical protein